MIKQLSVFVENKRGALVETTSILAQKHINIRAMALADTTKYGVLRMIVDDLPAAQVALQASGFLTKETAVVAVRMPDRSGALYDVVQCLAQIGEELEYLYAFNRGSQNSAYVVLRVQDVSKSEQALAAAGYTLFSEDDLANL